MREKDDRQRVTQNLVDAGCGEDIICKFFELEAEGRRAEQLCLLACHRKELLDEAHRANRCIDCLDYLTYKMRNCEGKEK